MTGSLVPYCIDILENLFRNFQDRLAIDLFGRQFQWWMSSAIAGRLGGFL